MKKKLTVKRERFVVEIQLDWNATKAARRSGFSEKTARSQGQRLLANVDIQAALGESRSKNARKAEVTVQDVLRYWKAGMLTPIDEFYVSGPDGELVPKLIEEMTDDAKLALESISVKISESGQGYQSIKKIDGMRCSENLAKHFGIDGVQRSEIGRPGEFIKLSEAEQIDAIDIEQRRLAQAADRIRSANGKEGLSAIH